MEAIHHVEFKGSTPDLCFMVTLPDLTPCPSYVPGVLLLSLCVWLANWLALLMMHDALSVTVVKRITTQTFFKISLLMISLIFI